MAAMSIREEQCNKICRILDNVLANRPTERDTLIVAVRKAFETLDRLPSAQPDQPPYVAEIESEYMKAVNMPYIKKPLAKALYEVWKKHDRDDAERKE